MPNLKDVLKVEAIAWYEEEKPLEMKAWLEADEEPKFVVPRRCSKCGRPTHIVDASRFCGIIFVHCTDSDVLTGKRCQWCEVIHT
jgi:hypothetical protein